ncbi:glycosyltransferase family 2 protein [Candidatus Nitrosocosmicus hydrocola]|uniref:glycosyltransferase family 2 protein n=1 Tax=Candidatus Nitrosocosmicus hydrocola TaxID=1826872 RepID=UPI0011E5E7EB|nr:glycosyltransferase family 2 protein [Candidatus Nitrosocosmicus hydrocola]
MTSVQKSPLNESTNVVICIPAFNEEKNIEEIIMRSKSFATEVIVYDDGSTDKTAEISNKCGAYVISSPRNKGYGKALNILFQTATLKNADIVVTIDSDGQHDPNQIPVILKPLLDNKADIVIGSRFLDKRDSEKVPKYRSFGIKAITKVTQAGCYEKITDAQSGYRAYNSRALSKLRLSENGMAISTEILLRADEHNLRIVEVPISIRYDVGNGSTHNPIIHGSKVFTHVIQFLAFKHPFLFYGLPGLLLLIFSAAFLYNALELFSSTRYVSTNMIIISIGLSLIGMILIATSAIVHTLISLFKGQIREI